MEREYGDGKPKEYTDGEMLSMIFFGFLIGFGIALIIFA